MSFFAVEPNRGAPQPDVCLGTGHKQSSTHTRWRLALVASMIGLLPSSFAWSHFVWLAPCTEQQQEPAAGQAPTTLQVFFGEDASPDDPELLKLVKDMQLWNVSGDAEPVAMTLKLDDQSLSSPFDLSAEEHAQTVFYATHDLGVRDKGGDAFRLVYYAKAGPPADAVVWTTAKTPTDVKLDIKPSVQGGKVILNVLYNGSAVEGAEVKAVGPGLTAGETLSFTGTSGKEGEVSFAIAQPGRYSIRARHIEQVAGKADDKAYSETRHYATLTLDVPTQALPLPVDQTVVLPELPSTLTSFGAAIVGDQVFVYGGTRGTAHNYYKGVQSGELLSLQLATGKNKEMHQWQVLGTGIEVQGLAMVAHAGKLYRLGGFEAKNAEGEESSLWSVNEVRCFDPVTKQWSDMPALPEPRSSFDAVTLNGKIYVVGGWSMQGDARSVWHKTAWKLDLEAAEPKWEPIANPPFERRALTLATHEGKIYAIGGMTSGDETVRDTDVYDPASDQWTTGPELVGTTGMTGFGASAFATGGALYVSTMNGSLQRLSNDGSEWNVVGQTPSSRFFHRMLPIDDKRFVMIGGTNMRAGRIKATEVFAVP